MPAPSRRIFFQQAALTAALTASTTLQADSARRDPIRIGQIGVGHPHATKLAVYRQLPDYEVVGIVEPDEQRRAAVADHPAYHGLPWMTTEQLLNTPQLRAVLVETEVQDLLSTAQACVSAGKHIHLDKPAGSSLPTYRQLLQDAEAKNLLVQMGYMYRYNPGVLLLRQCLNQGWLGDIFRVHAVMSKVVGPDARLDLARYPGGMMFELGCHILDLVIGVLGRPLQVQGIAMRSGPQDDALADNTLALLTYPRAIATVESSGLEVNGGERRHLVVCGTRGTLQIQPLDNPSVQLTLDEPQGEFKRGTQQVTFPRFVRYIADAIDMARIIRGEKSSDFTPSHDLTVQETLLRACHTLDR